MFSIRRIFFSRVIYRQFHKFASAIMCNLKPFLETPTWQVSSRKISFSLLPALNSFKYFFKVRRVQTRKFLVCVELSVEVTSRKREIKFLACFFKPTKQEFLMRCVFGNDVAVTRVINHRVDCSAFHSSFTLTFDIIKAIHVDRIWQRNFQRPTN